ncbi:MAG: hypothetical protein AB8B50_06870, partial [Pirellulaceae bacterium]
KRSLGRSQPKVSVLSDRTRQRKSPICSSARWGRSTKAASGCSVTRPMVAIGKGIKDAWPKPGQLTRDEITVNNGF